MRSKPKRTDTRRLRLAIRSTKIGRFEHAGDFLQQDVFRIGDRHEVLGAPPDGLGGVLDRRMRADKSGPEGRDGDS